jgi:hypothetical protein
MLITQVTTCVFILILDKNFDTDVFKYFNVNFLNIVLLTIISIVYQFLSKVNDTT